MSRISWGEWDERFIGRRSIFHSKPQECCKIEMENCLLLPRQRRSPSLKWESKINCSRIPSSNRYRANGSITGRSSLLLSHHIYSQNVERSVRDDDVLETEAGKHYERQKKIYSSEICNYGIMRKHKRKKKAAGKLFRSRLAWGAGEVNILGCGLNKFLFEKHEGECASRNIIYYHLRLLSINK